jgi:hypothetical protein
LPQATTLPSDLSAAKQSGLDYTVITPEERVDATVFILPPLSLLPQATKLPLFINATNAFLFEYMVLTPVEMDDATLVDTPFIGKKLKKRGI